MSTTFEGIVVEWVQMPYSEVCMSMRIAGKYMFVQNVGNHMAQLYEPQTPLKKFSAPITWGEAGITPESDIAKKWEESDATTSEVHSRG